MMMFIIGMTGGIGSGKSEALKIFESLNIKVIDLDKISKEITDTSHQARQEIKLVSVSYIHLTLPTKRIV